MKDRDQTVYYQRGRFTSRLPSDRLYTPSHFWLREAAPGLWHIGFTKFATRMLGEIVEFQFSVNAPEAVTVGQTIGWIEGFKAVSDLYCVAAGEFAGANPALAEDITRLDARPYDAWLYAVRGVPDPHSGDVRWYTGLLDMTIDKMKEQLDERPAC